MPDFNEYEDDKMEVHFSKEDFEKWLNNITANKFNHYLAWFNINIKQCNS